MNRQWTSAGHDPELLVAAAAADAARATPGVVRLQPGLWGLVRQLGREMLDRNGHVVLPDVGGVEVVLDRAGASVEVSISMVLQSGHNAVVVSEAVHAAVRAAVEAETGMAVASVATNIVDIDLAPLLGRAGLRGV